MKTVSILSAVLSAACAVLPATAEAGSCRMLPRPAPAAVCRPVYIGTKVIACRTECRWTMDECGRRWSYEVNVTTYADLFSDGSCRTYTKTTRI